MKLLWLLPALLVVVLGGCISATRSGDATPGYVSKIDDPATKALFHYGRARMLMADEKGDEAIAALQEAIRLDPDNEELRFELAEWYIELDQVKMAIRAVEDILIRNPDSIEAHLRLGNAYFGSRQPELAIPHFRKIIELDPANEEVRLHLAISLARSGEPGPAIEELKELIARFPASQIGRLSLARLYRETKLDALAIEQYRLLMKDNPELSQVAIELGMLYEERRQWNDALDVFRAALVRKPLDFSLRHHLARVYVGMKRYTDALNELQTIVDLRPDDFDARRKIGLIFLEQEKWDKAITVFRETLAMRPDLEPVRYYLGTALERKEDWSAALDAFRMIAQDSPLYDDAVAHMGYIFVQTRRPAEAVSLLEARLQQPEPRAQVYYYLAILYLGSGDEQKALAVLDQGLESFPEDTDLLYEKALTYERLRQHQAARETMRKVIAGNPDHAEALNFIAYALAEENRDLAEALSMAERALAIKPAGHIFDTLGWIYYRLGRFEEARKATEEAVRLLGKDDVVLEHLGDIHAALGKPQAARNAYKKALEASPGNKSVDEKLRRLGPGE